MAQWEKGLNTLFAPLKGQSIILDVPMLKTVPNNVEGSLQTDMLIRAFCTIYGRELVNVGANIVFKRLIAPPKPFGKEPDASFYSWLTQANNAEIAELFGKGMPVASLSSEGFDMACQLATMNDGLASDIFKGNNVQIQCQIAAGISYVDAGGHTRHVPTSKSMSFEKVSQKKIETVGNSSQKASVPLDGKVVKFDSISRFLREKGKWINYDNRMNNALVYFSKPMTMESAELAMKEIGVAKTMIVLDNPTLDSKEPGLRKLKEVIKKAMGDDKQLSKFGLDQKMKLKDYLTGDDDLAQEFASFSPDTPVTTGMFLIVGMGNNGSSPLGGYLKDGKPNMTRLAHSIGFLISP